MTKFWLCLRHDVALNQMFTSFCSCTECFVAWCQRGGVHFSKVCSTAPESNRVFASVLIACFEHYTVQHSTLDAHFPLQ